MMDKKIHPDKSILEALFSESTQQTPFSRIPGFIKKFTITEHNKEKMVSLLSSLAEKELKHLEVRTKNIQDENNISDPDIYSKIVEIEWWKDPQGRNIHAKLIWLAKEIIASEMWLPVYNILKNLDAELGTWPIDPSKFENNHLDTSENFTDEEKDIIQQEQQVRIIMNALIMWAGHRIFDKIETDKKYPKAINKIDPDLYKSYYDLVYANLKNMRETPPSNVTRNNTGSMQLINEDNVAKIKIQADIFPVLLHEMAKWVVEYMAYTRYNNLNPEMISSILSVDSHESEHWMMLLGPQIYKQLFFLIKESIAQYNEKHWILDDKQESDYIIPIISHVVQLPANQFLSFMETILRQDQDGQKSIELITKIIDNIHNQYEWYLVSSNAPKMKLTVKEIMEQLTRELNLWKKEQVYIKSALPDLQYRLESNWYFMPEKKLAKKIAEHYLENKNKFQLSDTVDQSWLTEVGDAIQWFKKSRIEKAAFSLVHEQQKKFPKWIKNHAGESINIHPRFPLSTLEEAKKNVHPQVLQDIDNQVHELIQKWSITEWLKDHDTMSVLNGTLTERFITLDNVTPECIMQRADNRWLYELTTLEQLKRESGAMGNHCVADYIDSIKKWSLRVFSLRLWTKSRRTIWYQPWTQTINQVKWYTNQKWNATITTEDPDYLQLIDALVYLSQNLNVKKINDINVLYEQWFLLTNKWLLNPEQFVEHVKQNDVYEIALLQQEKTMNLKDMDILEKLNLNNIKNIRYQLSWAVIVYSTDDQKLSVTRDSYWLFDEQEIAKAIAALFWLKKHEFFANYDGYPVFLLDWIKKDDNYATVKKNWKYWIIKKTAHGYKEIFPCIYDIAPWFTEMWQAIVKKNWMYGVFREEENDNRITTIQCEYDEVPKFSLPWLMQDEAIARKDQSYWIIRENENGLYTQVLPCIYDNMPIFWTNWLEKDEARVNRNEDLPFHNTGKYWVIKRSDGWFEEILKCKYDDIPVFWTGWLVQNEARVKRNQKYWVLKKEGTKFEEVLSCRYDSIPDNQPHGIEAYGLIENEYIVYQDAKRWVIRKNNDTTWSEVLPCEYDMISWTEFLGWNEIVVLKDRKQWFFKRDNEKFIEILPCEYEEITEFWKSPLSLDETIVKKNWKYWIIRKDKGNMCTEILPCEYDSRPEFWDNILKDNEVVLLDELQYCITKKLPKFWIGWAYCQAKIRLHWKQYFWKKNDDDTRDETIYEKYEEIKFKEFWLQDGEARVQRDKKWWIIKDNKDGTWKPILPCIYNSLAPWFAENAVTVSIWKYSNEYGVLQRNDDGTRTEIVPCEYQEMQFWTKWLLPREAMVKGKNWSAKWIIKIDIDGKLQNIVPCQYDSIKFWIKWLWPREAIVANNTSDNWTYKNQYGIIKIHDDDTFTEILPCEYDEIREAWKDYALVLKDKRTLVLQKKSDWSGKLDTRTRFFSNAYDEILQFATGGLWPDEAVVRDNNKLMIIRRNKNGLDEKIESEYMMKDFWMFWLRDGEARAKKPWQGMWIIKRSKDWTIKEVLPCIYAAIGTFGDSMWWLQDDEVVVMKDWNCGIVRRTKNWYKEVLPCKYYSIWMFGEEWLNNDEARVQEERDWNYTIIKKMPNWYKETNFSSYETRCFDFWKYWLLANESFLSVYDGRWRWMLRKDADGTYNNLFYDDYTFDLKWDRKWLLANEYRGMNMYSDEVIFYRKEDGSWGLTNAYSEIFPLWRDGCASNEAIVRYWEKYWIIKRNDQGSWEETLLVWQYYFDEDFSFNDYSPILFSPDLINWKRVVLAVQEHAEKVILVEEDWKFLPIADSEQWLLQNENFREFFSSHLNFDSF